ncbi:hypothetical protein PMAYCL1PPCAC_25275, partial [Pristionchus mayeri]
MGLYTSAITFADSGLCLFLYCIITARIFRLQNKPNAAELRMLLLGFSILLTNIPAILYQLSWIIVPDNGEILFQTLPWV